ncbi:MAG: HAD-IC family P-type ATPase, partial [Patescibacteria group bacterium]
TLIMLKEQKDVHNIDFLGLVGFADPVRDGVKEAFALTRKAGIKVVVITGDYRWTAEHVLSQIGIKISRPDVQIIEGEELANMGIEELTQKVADVVLFARVTPSQKLKIVDVLKRRGEVVALVGDGVNDAPALKRADIGIVVGDASDVARETADLVLLDSNFATIVAAVEEGRGIFANIQKVMTYLMSDTFAEVIIILLSLLFGVPLPLTAAQILWINLVTDTFPTLALTMEPKEENLLERPPISPDLPILSRSMVIFMMIVSFSSGIICFLLFVYLLKNGTDLLSARLIIFTVFSLKSLVYVFSLRDRSLQIWRMSLTTNWYLIGAVGVSVSLLLMAIYSGHFHVLLGTRSLQFTEWILAIGVSLIILFIVEMAKVGKKWIT